MFIRALKSRIILAMAAGAALGAAGVVAAGYGVHSSSTPEFCMSCHEMRLVGEQGWMESVHYRNPRGVVAGCSDCHVPPDLPRMLYVKTRDGMWDIYVHTFGESNPHRMDWDELERSARAKVYDSSCRRCHLNLSPNGGDLKAAMAHRENSRLETPRRCVDCHRREFHGRFRERLSLESSRKEEEK